ncbi:hypothetical protein [Streptomyces sioyaensis]|uniref:hypothetical protein n=1 Tax=Streptomyces sioyaensis TaxID=67364 RepID=UPI00378FEF08
MAPRYLLGFEVLDAVRLRVVELCLSLRGFPAQVLLSRGFQVGQSLAFGGFSSETYFLHDLGELVLKGASGGIGAAIVFLMWLSRRAYTRWALSLGLCLLLMLTVDRRWQARAGVASAAMVISPT